MSELRKIGREGGREPGAPVTAAAIEAARAARRSVAELDRLIYVGGLLRLSHDGRDVLRKFCMTPEEGLVAERLSLAEERGQFAGGGPFTLEEAKIAAGIEC